jgi:peroxiredoxin
MRQILLFVLLASQLGWAQAQSPKTAILRGKVTNPAADSVEADVIFGQFSIEHTVHKAKVGPDGSFNLELPIASKWQWAIFNSLRLSLAPGDVLEVAYDGQKPLASMRFSGAKAAENNFLVSYAACCTYHAVGQARMKQIGKAEDFAEYRLFEDSVARLQQSTVQAAKASLPADFLTKITASSTYGTAYEKLRFYLLKPFLTKGSNPPHDTRFLDSLQIQDQSLVYHSDYQDFMVEYVNYYLGRLWTQLKPNPDETDYHTFRYRFVQDFFSGPTRELLLAELLPGAFRRGNWTVAGQLYEQFRQAYPQSEFLPSLARNYQAAKRLAPGSVAPNFTFTDLAGKPVSLADFRGKVVYLDVWASWCGPCIEQIPAAKILKEKFKDRDVVFLYVSIDAREKSWRSMIEDKQLTGVHLISNQGGIGWESPMAKLYNIQGVPSYFLIGRDGKIFDNNPPRPGEAEKVGKALERALAQSGEGKKP